MPLTGTAHFPTSSRPFAVADGTQLLRADQVEWLDRRPVHGIMATHLYEVLDMPAQYRRVQAVRQDLRLAPQAYVS